MKVSVGSEMARNANQNLISDIQNGRQNESYVLIWNGEKCKKTGIEGVMLLA